MFITSEYLLMVICLTIVSLTRSFSPIDKDAITKALSCTVMQNYTKDANSYCSLVDLDKFEDKFHRIYYACMELYDISLQMCDKEKEITSSTGMVLEAAGFCKGLKFYDKRAESTKHWADIAVKFLSSPENCEKVCISENSIHPICEAIYIGNNILIKTAEDVQAQLSVTPITHINATSHSQNFSINTANTSSSQSSYVSQSKEPTKSLISNPENFKIPSDDKGQEPKINEESNKKRYPEEKIFDSQISEDFTRTIIDKKGEEDSTRSEDRLPVVNTKTLEDTQSFASKQQLSEQSTIENDPQISGKPKSEGSQSLSSAIHLPSVSPPPIHEPFYKDSTDERDDMRDSSKDGEIENEVVGDVSFKEETGSSIITQEESLNIYASGEPEENLGITGSKFSSRFPHAQDSHFFAYFLTMVVICIIGYLVFHNKQKIIALALEGRMQGSRRRPNTSNYKKLDSNLEEAVTSNCSSSSVTHVIF